MKISVYILVIKTQLSFNNEKLLLPLSIKYILTKGKTATIDIKRISGGRKLKIQ